MKKQLFFLLWIILIIGLYGCKVSMQKVTKVEFTDSSNQEKLKAQSFLLSKEKTVCILNNTHYGNVLLDNYSFRKVSKEADIFDSRSRHQPDSYSIYKVDTLTNCNLLTDKTVLKLAQYLSDMAKVFIVPKEEYTGKDGNASVAKITEDFHPDLLIVLDEENFDVHGEIQAFRGGITIGETSDPFKMSGGTKISYQNKWKIIQLESPRSEKEITQTQTNRSFFHVEYELDMHLADCAKLAGQEFSRLFTKK